MTVFPAKMIGGIIFHCVISILGETFCMRFFIFYLLSASSFFELYAMPLKNDTIPSKYDSSLIQLLLSQEPAESDAVLMNEETRSNASAIISPLHGEKDMFLQMVAFQFSAMRYRYRGYDASFQEQLLMDYF